MHRTILWWGIDGLELEDDGTTQWVKKDAQIFGGSLYEFRVGGSGNWVFLDEEAREYIDSGIPAIGQKRGGAGGIGATVVYYADFQHYGHVIESATRLENGMIARSVIK